MLGANLQHPATEAVLHSTSLLLIKVDLKNVYKKENIWIDCMKFMVELEKPAIDRPDGRYPKI